MSINKGSPQVIPLAQPTQFFIAPAPGPGYALQLPPNSAHGGSGQISNIGIASWPPTLRPPQPFHPTEIFFAQQSSPQTCLLAAPPPVASDPKPTPPDNKPILPPSDSSPLLHPQPGPDSPPSPITMSRMKRVKKEPLLSGCKRNEDLTSSSTEEKSHPYSINALIDVPSLTRSSRTSSLSSSLSSFRFGGSLSQIWATSLNSLSGKLNNMKSTGNLHAEASLPSLNNQYFAFGGSLPELSLTSLTRLLPTSSASSSSDTSSSSAGLYTLIQSPLCVYPSQPHLATPFVNANGSITFGSFLSNGSSLCSSNAAKTDPGGENERRDSGTPPDDSSPRPPSTSYNSQAPPGSLSTLAYVASVQKTLDTSDQFPLMTVTTQLPPGHSPNHSSLSPIPPSSCLSPSEDLDCTVGSPSRHPFNIMHGDVKLEEEEPDHAYSDHAYPDFHHHHHGRRHGDSKAGGRVPKKEGGGGKDKPYKCDYPGCGRSFSFPAHLRSHVQQIHISYRPCKCDFPGCGKRFYTPQHLNVHRRIHTGERPFVCPYANCGKAFTTAGNLKNHIRTHTGERPYACKFDGCSKRFAEMSSLKKHELTHTGEKPYKCRVCGKAFSQAGSRNTHERKHSRTDDMDSKISRRYRIKRVSQDEEM